MNMDESSPVNAKVSDFGLSRQVPQNLTEILPTWRWLPPEVIDPDNSRGYDERADIYSFGIVCWEIATNMEVPFGEFQDREKTVINKIIHQNLRPTIPESCPEEFANLIKSCWDVNPVKRPSFDQIVEQINIMIEQAPASSTPSMSMDDSL